MPLQWQKAAVSLVCSTEAETKHCVSSTAATSWWLLTAGLYCRQMSIGATAVAKAAVSLFCSTEAETKHWCLQHCCNILVVAYCRLVLQANVNRCHCSGKRLLSAWFAVLRQRPNMVSPALLQHLGGCLLQACIAGKCQ